ncbi:RNA-directed DNA polymerase, eukaryota, partial [Tanacetum coccineum]
DPLDRKITWVAWNKVLASKRKGGLGVSSLYALNRALLLKWAWRFISKDNSLWFQVIQAHLYALEMNKLISVAEKLDAPISALSFRREVRGGIEQQQWSKLVELVGSVSLSSSPDRWFCELSGDGVFTVKVVRNFLDDMLLPSHPVVTSWSKFIPIKVSIFAWRARRDCLPTRYNLSRRGVVLDSIVCPICNSHVENIKHIFFQCEFARCIFVIFVGGGIWIGWRFLPLRIDMFGSPQSVYRLLLNLCWKESLALLGGGFGRFAIGLFLITLLPGGRWSLMKLFRILLIGFPIDVIGLSLGLFG